MKNVSFLLLAFSIFINACGSRTENTDTKITATSKIEMDTVVVPQAASLQEMLAKKEVPVLCYHHIRNFIASQSENMKSYSVTPKNFAAQMKALHDSGYQTILPAQ